jgi:thiamine pyrophosphokinase
VASARQVLAADGGARFLLGLGVRPDVVVGDFDSLSAADTRRLEGEGVELIRHPVRKDSTDGELAVEEALRRGAGELVLAGGTGALDHTLGHLAILGRLAALGVPARLVTPSLTVRVFRAPADVVLGAGAGTRVSLAPLGGDARVTLTGLEYPLDHGVLPAEACLGLGNRVLDGGAARIGLHSGSVAVLVEAGDERFGSNEGRRGARPADATETQGTAS